jgi:CDP-diacylglycerol--serine O-phosphatidyltransferase
LIKNHIPNTVTLLNLLSGSISVLLTLEGQMVWASAMIGLGAIFDFLDGMLARLLNARSPIGLQLDSLADVITFGLAPSFIMYQLMASGLGTDFQILGVIPAALPAFLIVAFSALRLAKFNIDDSQQESFSGLPTPANAIFFASFPLVLMQAQKLEQLLIINLLQNYWILLSLTGIFSLLMVSSVPLLSLKFKSLSLQENKLRYLLIFAAAALFITIKYLALPLIIIIYILLSMQASRSAK